MPEGEKLLMDNDIYVNGKKGAPSAAANILKQQPNSGIWVFGAFISPALGVYSWGKGREGGVFSRVGDAPVILDTSQIARGSDQLQAWYFNHGYFKATTHYKVTQISKKKQRARANYFVQTGPQYYLDSINYQVSNNRLMILIEQSNPERLVSPGDPYNADLLDDERDRLAQIFRNHGYYGFNKNFAVFEADTFKTGDSVDVNMLINPQLVRQGDSTALLEHNRYRISKVYIRPDQNYQTNDPPIDTTDFLDYHIIYDTLQYKPRYLTDAIHFKPGDYYSQEVVRGTYAHLVNYGAFELTEINFKTDPSDSSANDLIATINLSPQEKRTFIIEPEGTYTSGNFGVRGNLSYIDRNLFKAGEELQVRFTAGFERQPTPGSDVFSPTLEAGTEVGLKFPRFLLPFNTVGLVPKRMQPSSRVSVSIRGQQRVEFARLTGQTGLAYQWRESLRKTHQINLMDLAYSRLYSISNSFINDLNPIQQRAFQSELISATRYTFTYNEQVNPRFTNFRFFRGSLEIAGNTLSLADQLTGLGSTNSNGNRELLGAQYFQYGKVDVDARHYWNFTKSRTWVNRVFSGYIIPWGNSTLQTDTGAVRIPPFSRYYFMGGGNDLRGWPAYRLGPGREGNTNYSTGRDTTFATGTFKLLLNSEYRFRIISSLNGAVFLDAGNIWNTGGIQTNKSDLSWEGLYNELAISSGMGLRLDLDFFVIRFDVGVKVRDPALRANGNEWVLFTKPVFPNLSYHVALGYPF
ncbi:MAG: BamA/TamA family outer membrane protein [Owenweeksia sp.]|nr:BamA/TamA family outer membrane protein [Owenweeksia sp.]